VCILLFAITSCTSGKKIPPEFFDAAAWKNDKNACKGERKRLFEQFEKVSPLVEQMSKSDLVENFGVPDRNILHDRGQRFFGYMIDPCCEADTNASCRMLQCKIDPLDRVREVVVVVVKK
jgi:hypothetical protein